MAGHIYHSACLGLRHILPPAKKERCLECGHEHTSPAILGTGKMLIDAHTHLDMYEEDLESAHEEMV